MTYSYTQISQYLSCPRRYKHRYLDGWKEKDTRAAMLFGRAFEQAVGAYFQRKDAAAVLHQEWASHRDSDLHYSERDSWDRMLQSGVQLLDRFAQDDRVRIRQPRRNLQVKFTKPWPGRMTSWPTSMPSGNSTAPAACWSGKPLPAVIRRSRQDCSLSIRSWFATPGSPASQTWPRWCLSASGWSRSSIFEPRSATNSGRSLAIWSRTRSEGSRRPSSCLTAASAFPRTPAPAVPTLGSVWDGRI